ncbi:MAG: hypothetical protein KF760_03505 [Candidatus Eremiobacteraeota bacterium]|nr:hypothetical protein [Candidatus Eremiobacteraeota bacterium]
MIREIPNGLKPKQSNELKAKQIQALQQAEAARKLETDPDKQKNLPLVDQVTASREISEEFDGAYEQKEHQGLEALLANFGAQEPKKLEANDKVNEVGKGSEVARIKENPDKKPPVRELKEDEKRSIDKAKDPKAADRMGNLKVSSKKEAQGVKDKPQAPTSEHNPNHHKMGSKGAPKTDAPRPVGATEQLRAPKPDGKVGLRQLPQMRNNGADKTDFSEEIKQALASQKQAVA